MFFVMHGYTTTINRMISLSPCSAFLTCEKDYIPGVLLVAHTQSQLILVFDMGKKGRKQQKANTSSVGEGTKPSSCPIVTDSRNDSHKSIKSGEIVTTLESSHLSKDHAIDTDSLGARKSTKSPFASDTNPILEHPEISCDITPPVVDPTFASIPDSPENPIAADCDTGLGSTRTAKLIPQETHASSPVGSTVGNCRELGKNDPTVGVTTSFATEDKGALLDTLALEKASGYAEGPTPPEPAEEQPPQSQPYPGTSTATDKPPSCQGGATDTEVGLLRGHGYKYIALAAARLVGLLERALVHTSEEIGRGCGIKRSLLRMVTRRGVRGSGDVSVYAGGGKGISDDGTEALAGGGEEGQDQHGDATVLVNPNDATRVGDLQVLSIVCVALWSCMWAFWDLMKTIAISVVCSTLKATVSFWLRMARHTISVVAWLACLMIYMPLYILKIVAYAIFPDLAHTHTACVVSGVDVSASADSDADEGKRATVQRVQQQTKLTDDNRARTEALADRMAALGSEAAARALARNTSTA